MSDVPMLTLNDGRAIPQLGLGVFQIPSDETAEAVAAALEIGYRHVDTAEGYGNERGVGDGVRASGLDRAEVFVTSKLDNRSHRPDDARRAFEGTLTQLGFDYIDLFLIHWPVPSLDFVATWKTLEEFRNDGRARSIGVSNFEVEHLELLARETGTVPAVNQIELHPQFQNRKVAAYGRAHGIRTEAWSPIAQGAALTDPTVVSIAVRLGRSPSQVVLRWHIERGTIVIPKSSRPEGMKENCELFDFELLDDDRAAIDALHRGEAGRPGVHPNDVREDTW